MINTLNIKQQQLSNGFFTTGSGKDVMLIMGSCRVAPYVNYFNRWNIENNNKYTIHSIDPFNLNWNINDDRVDYQVALDQWETDTRMITMLQSVDVFLHEHYQNAGMFNVSKDAPKNIYQSGMNPSIDVCLPNWNDLFVLVNDILKFDVEMRKKAEQDVNVLGKLSGKTQHEIFAISKENIQKFISVCYKSDIPEMAYLFLEQYKKKRFFVNYNHVTKHFTLAIFEFINEKFLNLNLSKEFMEEISKEDMFANNFTRLTDYDIKFNGYNWGEEIVPLSL